MHRSPKAKALILASLFLALAVMPAGVEATQIWSGRTFAFSKAANADYTLAANQDRITPLVWITRGGSEGIFNIKSEAAFTDFVSPAGTEWANGDAVNYAILTFATWETWAQAAGGPPSTVNKNAVVHLIAEDIYIDIRFDAWGVGPISGGSFSYHRGQDPAVPVARSTWGRIKSLYNP